MTQYAIETFDLTKKYKLKGQNREILALNNANVSIKEGEMFGLLGPNGAGKTTMIQILTTLLQPTSGYALINGANILKNPRKVKDSIALMLESDMLYYRVSGYDNLKFFCKIYKVLDYKKKIYSIAEEFGLDKWLNQYVEKYSSGMKMKLALCRTLLIDRKILFLDEPTLGLDVKTISFIIDKLKNENKTIFLTSHDMSVVEKLCDTVAFINKGQILKIGTKEDIKKLEQSEIKLEISLINDSNELKNELKSQEFIIDIVDNKNFLIITLKERKNYQDLLSILVNYKILKIKEIELTLNELFLKII